ncbi:Ypt/Rab-GAP domain of gyp1p superfamily protein [Actinidia rufa]|uniref:Ypt/Rab-GAP domain of gyp1p superfamily protein n=1 Tax=Actinidia rufa TaxID=165716 RepID=A0A7J0EBV0_9ERIC|nr:Ypt/Rab-GAP domain of gyp1p superfamily protein [Actinidia rufa]
MKAKSASAVTAVLCPPVISFEHKRDAYGFALRPQHVQRYREYANIYKEEEEERSDRWNDFLERQAEPTELPVNGFSSEEDKKASYVEAIEQEGNATPEKDPEGDDITGNKPSYDDSIENVKNGGVPTATETRTHRVQIWTVIRPSLRSIEDMMSIRARKKCGMLQNGHDIGIGKPLPPIEEFKSMKEASEEDSEDEFYDVERSDPMQDVPSNDSVNAPDSSVTVVPSESLFPWKEELECLVRGGVPMALRGELWQAFVGARARRVEKYYKDLLGTEAISSENVGQQRSQLENTRKGSNADPVYVPEKWKGQIEKDLPRTFPGHPALDEDGRNALRRLLTAYARHNPSVGYCQFLLPGLQVNLAGHILKCFSQADITCLSEFLSAMNFFAGLLLLLMPEENAFWTLMGILDDYFDGYYSEEMIESQVDQLVFEELSVIWITLECRWHGSLDRGPALVTTKDAGDAVTLLQSLAGSTFDSSQLVLTACMGYQNVNEVRLQELRHKHRPSIRATVEERSKGLQAWRDSQGLASKLYGFKHDPASLMIETSKSDQLAGTHPNGDISHTGSGSGNVDGFLMSLNGDVEIDSVPDLQQQVVWLKVELCKLLEEKQSAVLRAEELETALMEMVKQDNRRQLSARVEQLEREVAELRQAIADKQEQENAMLQVLMRVEQEQRVTEDARRFAEQDAAAQRYASQVLQEKYEEVTANLAEMEKRAVMAESMLEATLQYQSGQIKAQPSPRSVQQDSSPVQSNQEPTQDLPMRKISLLSRPFGIGWRDRNKVSDYIDSSLAFNNDYYTILGQVR